MDQRSHRTSGLQEGNEVATKGVVMIDSLVHSGQDCPACTYSTNWQQPGWHVTYLGLQSLGTSFVTDVVPGMLVLMLECRGEIVRALLVMFRVE